MAKAIEYTLTGCVDCGVIRTIPIDRPETSHPIFKYGTLVVRMWREPDEKHHLILVAGRPERMLLSCQPFAKLLTENGVAAILNLVENIKPTQEVGR